MAMQTGRLNEAARGRAGRLGLALVVVLATSLLAASSAASSPGKGAGARSDENQGDPDKVLTVESGYACAGSLVAGAKIEGGLGRTVEFSAATPIVQVTLKSGNDATVVSSSFAADYRSGSVTLSKDVSNYIVWTCSAPPAPAKATLTVIKQLINDNGGTKTASDFTLLVTGGNPSPASFAGSAGGTRVQLDAGSYSVTEPAVSGYSASYSAGCAGTIAAGGTATCTVTNNDNPPTTTPTPPATPPSSPTPPATPASPPTPPATPSSPLVPTSPMIDLSIVKTDTPDPAHVGGRLTYRLAVTNRGAVRATNVVVTDEIPVKLQFSSVSTTQGTCTGGRVVTCALGSLEVGGSASITIVVRPLSPGLVVNTATVTGAETDSNPADNTSSAVTRVKGPFAPPAARCPQLLVGQRTLAVGRRAMIVARVRLAGRGLRGTRITVRGAGVRTGGRTNAAGIARIAVRPTRTGIIVIRIAGRPARCGARRIGVVGTFRPPPLTG
jgi:uncharacterized repeat protein (TIGR01451 family)